MSDHDLTVRLAAAGLKYLNTEREAATYLRIAPGTLRNQRSAGTGLPYVKIGSRVLYRGLDLLAATEAALVRPEGVAA